MSVSANEIDFNCECESTSSFDTLQTLRRRMALRGGYASQADNLPSGVSAMFDDYLQSAQRILYQNNPSLRTERFYRWSLVAGVRYYGINDSDVDTELSCEKDPLATRVTWVGLEDEHGTWLPMSAGINPTWYTTASQRGVPSAYEIRSCIEIFPAPDVSDYNLWVKGHFGLDAFAVNADRTTIESELVFLLALGNFKTDKGQNGASNVLSQAGQYLIDLKAGRHQTRRYIPRLDRLPPAARPAFLPLQ